MAKRTLSRLKKSKKKSYPFITTLILIAVIFSLIGLIFVFEASSVKAIQTAGDSFHFLKLQLRWIGLGIAAMIFFSFYNYKSFYYLAIPILGFVVFLLVVVLIPGLGQRAGGARSWIDLGVINIQPTEFAKLSLIIYLSSWFAKSDKKTGKFVSFILLTGFMIFLILLQPDMGAAIIIFSLSIAMYFISNQNFGDLFLMIPISAVGFIGLIFAAPYRLARLTAFMSPDKDPLGVGFHINQILISLSEGGIAGRGFGASRQKYLFLPEAHTDSIFAIIGEELGFIGSMLILFFYVVLLYKIYQIYNLTSDRFGRLLAGGIFSFFGLQIIVNLGGMVNLMPLTGVTLPFLSYGGSSMITSFALVGIAINIAKQSKKIS